MRKQKKAACMIMAATLALASAFPSFAATGWINVQRKWYYYDAAGNSIRNQWVEHEGNLYWLKDNGEMAIQIWVNFNNFWFWVNAQGALVKDMWIPVGKDWYYVGSDGIMLANAWLNKDGKTYYMNEHGTMVKGWQQIGGNWYYFDGSNGDMARSKNVGGYNVNADGVYIP